MGIRIDPTLTPVIGNPPPVGDGTLALHLDQATAVSPAQEAINIFLGATFKQDPDTGDLGDIDPVSRLPVAIADNGIRVSLDWRGIGDDNIAFGRYALRHNLDTGVYTFTLTSITEVISTAPGRIVFDVLEPRSWRLDITGPAGPLPSGWYVEAVKLSNEAAYDNSAVPKSHPSRYYTPEYLTEIEKWKPVQIRFMKQMASEAGTVNTVHPDIDGLYNIRNGFKAAVTPRDVMVAFCNEYDIAPWFNLSPGAEPALVESFATYVRDNLKPSLSVYASCSNEYWNITYFDANARYTWKEAWLKLKPKGQGTVTLDKTTRKVTFTGAGVQRAHACPTSSQARSAKMECSDRQSCLSLNY